MWILVISAWHRQKWQQWFTAAAIIATILLPITATTAAAGSRNGDARYQVDAREYPWSALGRVNAGGRGHCTGFLIGKRHVLTAAHCLYYAKEGRWWAPNELHFVAGYQRDTYLVGSKIESYKTPKAYRPKIGATLENAGTDWAVLTLSDPIGEDAGWLSLRPLTRSVLSQIENNTAVLLQAGYRRGRAHAITASFGCTVAGFFLEGRGLVHSCDVAKGDSGSPLLLFIDGEVRVAGINVISAQTDEGEMAGTLSIAVFHRDAGSAEAARAVRPAGDIWRRGQTPTRGGTAETAPLNTIDQLLRELGYLKDSSSDPGQAQRRAAISDFEAGSGIAVTGEPSVLLLGQLMQATRSKH